MPHATFWFARPFRDWIGQRSLTLHWEGRLTVRDVFERLAVDHPTFRINLPRPDLDQEAVNILAAIIMDGTVLSLESEIRDGASVDVLLPLTGGSGRWLQPPGDLIPGLGAAWPAGSRAPSAPERCSGTRWTSREPG